MRATSLCSTTVLLVLAAGVGGCGGAAESPADPEGAPASPELDPVRRQGLWKHWAASYWPNGEVPVCFEPSVGFGLRANIRTYITDSWARVARVSFSYFGDCAGNRAGRAVVSVDPNIPDLGVVSPPGSPHPGGFTSVTFQSQSPTKRTIIHEFGHVLGFHEENYEASSLSQCQQLCIQRTGEGTQLTPFDIEQSIMTQSCCPQLDRDTLSAWDVVGVQAAYGRRHPGTLAGTNAQCVTAPANGQLTTRRCPGGPSLAFNQQWRITGSRHLLAPLMHPNPHAAQVRNGSSASGTAIDIAFRADPPPAGQRWSFVSTEIRGAGNKCITVPAGFFYGSPPFQPMAPQLWTCANSFNARYKVVQVSTSQVAFRTANDGYCLTVPQNAGSGTLLSIESCGTSITNSRQIFNMTAGGELTWGGLCWDTQTDDVNDGRPLQLYTCKALGASNKRNQLYHFRTQIQSDLGLCLATSNSFDLVDGDRIQTGSCGSANTSWDYYFNP